RRLLTKRGELLSLFLQSGGILPCSVHLAGRRVRRCRPIGGSRGRDPTPEWLGKFAVFAGTIAGQARPLLAGRRRSALRVAELLALGVPIFFESLVTRPQGLFEGMSLLARRGGRRETFFGGTDLSFAFGDLPLEVLARQRLAARPTDLGAVQAA